MQFASSFCIIFLKFFKVFETTAIHCDNRKEKGPILWKNGSGNITGFHNIWRLSHFPYRWIIWSMNYDKWLIEYTVIQIKCKSMFDTMIWQALALYMLWGGDHMEQVMKTSKHLFSIPYCVCLLHVQDWTFSPNSFRNVNLLLATDRYYPLIDDFRISVFWSPQQRRNSVTSNLSENIFNTSSNIILMIRRRKK